MTRLRTLWRDPTAAGAAEFALILPVALLFLLGLIDVGRYGWAYNQLEKATQIGARWAAATTLIPGGETSTNGLYNYSFAVLGGVPQGTVVPRNKFPGVTCAVPDNSINGNAVCTCKTSFGSCAFDVTADQTAFTALHNRMAQIYPGIAKNQFRIDYDWSGLGYSGDPNGADVQPLITVSMKGSESTNRKRFPLWFMLGRTVPMPSAYYTITAEDLRGNYSH